MVNKDATRYFSSYHEQSVAEALGGEVVSNSGATKYKKGDVLAHQFLIDCKTSLEEKNQVTVKKDDLIKIRDESISMGKRKSALCFNFGKGTENYYVISERDMKDYIAYLREYEGE
jgi:hypothetical protein